MGSGDGNIDDDNTPNEMDALLARGRGGVGGDEDNGVLIPSGADDSAVAAKKRPTSRPTTGLSIDDGTPNNGSNSLTPNRRRIRKAAVKDPSSTASGNDENAQAKCIKYSALFLLVAQMVGLVLLMRYSRTSTSNDEPMYLASTAVFIMEVMKLVICVGVVFYQTGITVGQELYHHTIGSPLEILQLCVPSLLYTVQNNLLYLALTNLDAATYQVCYQLKILTTAIFSALLLQRKFSSQKWAALVVLTVGVAIVQLSGSGDEHISSSTRSIGEGEDGTAVDQEHRHDAELLLAANIAAAAAHQNRGIGLVAVICAACTSGFSGVYFGECQSALC